MDIINAHSSDNKTMLLFDTNCVSCGEIKTFNTQPNADIRTIALTPPYICEECLQKREGIEN